MEKQCSNCRSWRCFQGQDKPGECHRKAPSPNPHISAGPPSTITGTLWPITKPEQWCDEFKAKPEQGDTRVAVGGLN